MKQKQYPDIVDSKINPKQANPKYLIPKMVTESKLIPGPVLLASGRARSALTQAGPKSLRLSPRSSRSSFGPHACFMLFAVWGVAGSAADFRFLLLANDYGFSAGADAGAAGAAAAGDVDGGVMSSPK